ncbi:YqzH family protein [Ectobacillus polymachus]|uniref:YqzH family protein n=1 Tax=Ectobacillus polymachus TaxID=1508806 RepID=UPI003A899C4B
MDERLLQKMIRNCFLQYYDCEVSIPISVVELKTMISKIKNRQKNGEETIYELIEDAVYEYVTMKE